MERDILIIHPLRTHHMLLSWLTWIIHLCEHSLSVLRVLSISNLLVALGVYRQLEAGRKYALFADTEAGEDPPK
ncbi:hypothetical protein [Allochromatium palmeri]|uniref:Uncharacterized protein n=1 Tax=Allochromatium palmeri TaxID=231048 RepID=A0A6N8E8P4_9GAMM|nr:hypothetical protein [Allochromatium palmeri]MTW20505.1 hypothetical protein [Allochromatium palmeri]